MSLAHKAVKGGSWLAFFTFFSQGFSWLVTFWVARLLMPADYGLMALATIFTGYAAWFSELGLGAAIIHRSKPSQEDLSSIFWFALTVGVTLALSCFPIAYFSALFFHEPRLVPLTQCIAFIFICNGLIIVPLNLLKKDLEFKTIGFVKLVAVFVSCSFMLLSAHLGAGVWALLGGQILLALCRLILITVIARWSPLFHFSFQEVRSYIGYGVKIAIGRTLFYITDHSDKFIIGKVMGAGNVGYYSFALQLAQLPTEKITVLINQISFPLFSKLKDSKEEFNTYYLKIVKIIATLVIPLFIGGFLVAEELVSVVLGEKWLAIVLLFKYLCLAQIMTSLSSINNYVHNALGNPGVSMYFNGVTAVVMTVSFYYAAQFDIYAMIFPWCISYVLLSGWWIIYTIKCIDISISTYISNIFMVIIGSLFMMIVILLYKYYAPFLPFYDHGLFPMLVYKVMIGVCVYSGMIYFFDRELVDDILSFLRKK